MSVLLRTVSSSSTDGAVATSLDHHDEGEGEDAFHQFLLIGSNLGPLRSKKTCPNIR